MKLKSCDNSEFSNKIYIKKSTKFPTVLMKWNWIKLNIINTPCFIWCYSNTNLKDERNDWLGPISVQVLIIMWRVCQIIYQIFIFSVLCLSAHNLLDCWKIFAFDNNKIIFLWIIINFTTFHTRGLTKPALVYGE